MENTKRAPIRPPQNFQDYFERSHPAAQNQHCNEFEKHWSFSDSLIPIRFPGVIDYGSQAVLPAVHLRRDENAPVILDVGLVMSRRPGLPVNNPALQHA